jgi:hypothetical protein
MAVFTQFTEFDADQCNTNGIFVGYGIGKNGPKYRFALSAGPSCVLVHAVTVHRLTPSQHLACSVPEGLP